ncbi:MHYT domain-containing protein [Nocardiopsis aegyptia]|uniref:NO-binding membrane sensor protein with MHYT domain n=1 Tax=Nocardiopsis aegyptia TaxID=220378 RepID=A0A7Z0JBB7_9ACTN|nr:MHYT domain-containing protein [Nocardiopsis aegyptia]NYJ36168.1 NO-binding membrane sensor protein with MHYT domain [Nocardiopsis aegyptia]
MTDHLSQDWLTPAIAFAVSVCGSLLGLAFAARARRARGAALWQWLVLAALSLGGMAVWSMHFIAMMGFRVPGVSIRYDAFLTLVSGVTAVVVMGAALTMTIRRRTLPWLLASGVLAAAGVVSMHYTGMASMNMHGAMHHDPFYVTAACAIALVASTVAMWFSARLRGAPAIVAGALVMAVAVTSVHYTAMMGVHVLHPEADRAGPPEGSTASDLLLPVIVGLFVLLLVCSLFLMLGEDEERVDYSRSGADAPRPRASAPTAAQDYTPRHGVRPAPPAPTDDVWRRPRR